MSASDPETGDGQRSVETEDSVTETERCGKGESHRVQQEINTGCVEEERHHEDKKRKKDVGNIKVTPVTPQ